MTSIRTKYGDKYFVDNTAAAGAAARGAGVTPKLGDSRLQAQTDTAKRPDYMGPPVSAPTPPPVLANQGFGPQVPTTGAGGPAPQPQPQPRTDEGLRPEPTPPPVPEGEQPALPAQ